MMDLEQANRILELQPGAAFRQVSEAREDLLALWNPDRLSDHPRLRAKAARKIEEINQAYEVLMEHLGQAGLPGTPGTARPPEPTPSGRSIEGSGQGPGGSRDHRASLYEEVFSRRKQENQRGIPVWPIVGGALLLVLGIVLYQSWSSEEVAVDPEAASTEELPSEPHLTLPAGEPAREEAVTAEAVAAPAEAGEEKPPAGTAVAPRREPPPPTPAVSSPPPAAG